MRFTKMQGIGNDYVYVNGFEEVVHHPDELAIRMSRPHFGVGADGLVLILPDESADVPCAFSMRTGARPKCAAMPCGAWENMYTNGD